MASSIRRRARDGSSNTTNTEEEAEQPFTEGTVRPKLPLLSALLYSVYLLCFGIIIFITASSFNDLLPSPNHNKSDGFNAARAMHDLQGLVNIGPKVTGSLENEMMAIEYITKIVNDISKSAQSVHKLEMNLQKVSGSFSIGGLGLHYDNVQNIVVRIGPRNNASLLVNCHFDSVPSSPGASDDGLNCAVMLEVLRVISSSKQPIFHDVIFLFNGAEENPLLASHGFITQHKWAKDVRAFINLESCGAGGPEIMFQTGPNCSYVVEAYGEAAVHPSGNVVGEELFQSGIIPSDTDFRIFRDYGHIPGLDFAHCADGYVYHTKRDNLRSIPNMPGVIQHTGDNLLSMVRTFTGHNSKLASLHLVDKEKFVYFDVLGLFFVAYSMNTAFFVNFGTILLSIICILLVMRPARNLWIIVDIGVRSAALLTGLAISLIYNLLLAIIMDSFSASMTWFTEAYILVPLYIIPTIVLMSLPVSLTHFFLFRKKYQAESDNAMIYFLPTQLIWTAMLLVTSLMQLRSAFLFVTLVLPPAVVFIVLTIFYKRNNVLTARVIYFFSTIFSSLLLVNFGIKALKLFMPITGRAGPAMNPDLLIAGLVTLLTFAVYSYICCFSTYVRQIEKWASYVMIFHAGVTLALLFSNLGFPFSPATPQRILITDVTRNSSVPGESFLWIEPWERRGVSVLPKVATLPKVKMFCTDQEPHCALPWTSVKLFMKSTDVSRWLPSSAHKLTNMTNLEVMSDEVSKDNVRTVSLKIFGPDHSTLLMHTEMTLKSWSIDDVTPTPIYTADTGKSYAIRHVHGLHTPYWTVTLRFQIDSTSMSKTRKKIHIDLMGHHTHGSTQTSPNLDRFLTTLPSWVHVTPALATLKSYNL